MHQTIRAYREEFDADSPEEATLADTGIDAETLYA